MIGVSNKSLASASDLRLSAGVIGHMPVVTGTFVYDIVKDEATVCDTQKRILGFESNIVKFKDVMEVVDVSSSESFQEGLTTMFKESKAVSDELQLANGHIIKETYNCEYNSDDYEYRSPIRIVGTTKLLKVA